MRKISLILGLMLMSGGLSASGESPVYSAGYFVSSAELPLDALDKHTNWTPMPDGGINHRYSNNHYYIRVRLENSARPFHGILETDYNRLQRVDWIEKHANGGWQIRKGGADIPVSGREWRHASAAFSLDLATAEKREFYLHISSNTVMKINLRLRSAPGFFNEESQNLLIYGLYAGLLALMVIYNSILYWAFRDRAFLSYLILNILALIYYMAFDGVIATHILPEHPRIAHSLQSVVGIIYAGVYLLFLTQFGGFDKSKRILHHVLWYGGWLFVTATLPAHWILGASAMNKLSLYISFTCIMLGFIATLAIQSRGNAALIWFRAGNLILTVSAFIFVLVLFGFLPGTALTRNALRVGTFIELVCFSIALATRIRTSDENRRSAELKAEARTQFAANLSHEIRTPLTAIVGITDLLSETELSAQQAKYMKSLQSATQAMHALANDVLTFAKLDGDKMRVEEIAFSPAALIARTVEIYRYKAAEKKIELKHTAPPGYIHLMGDPTKIGQILSNLIGNALKFTAQSGLVSITGTVGAIANKQMLQIKVADNGVGIPEDKLAGLFEAYTQADASTERLYGGTGLGLNISRQLAKLMNGSLEAESRVGEGSTFTLTLYLDLAPAVQAQAQLDYARLVRKIPRALKILHVDDQADIRMLFQFYFANTQHQVDSAESAEEGLELYKKHHYDFVFSDIHMPGIGGIRGLEAIRAYAAEHHLNPHLVLCSGSMDPQEMLGKKVRILLKPIRTRDVYATIVELEGAT